jgi:nucleoside-diphosphate-sugar epimerase
VANAFLTGASGFLGSHLAERLLADGHEITAALRGTSRARNVPAGCRVVRVDFENPRSIAGHLTDVDVIYHVAGTTKGRSREEFDRGNAAVTAALAKAAGHVCPEALFVLVSSQSASGPAGSGPLSAYGASKLLAEQAARAVRRLVIVRPPAVIGPGDTAARPVFRNAARGFFVSPATRGGFALVYVGDLARLLALLPSAEGVEGRTLQPSYDELFTWERFHGLLEGAAGKRVLHVRIPPVLVRLTGSLSELMSAFTRESPLVTRDKAAELLCCDWELEDGTTGELTGWKPEVPVDEAFSRTYEWSTSCSRTS